MNGYKLLKRGDIVYRCICYLASANASSSRLARSAVEKTCKHETTCYTDHMLPAILLHRPPVTDHIFHGPPVSDHMLH